MLLLGGLALASPGVASARPPDRATALETYLKIWEAIQPSGWTGNVEGCVLGAESAASIAATLSTVNALRDFAGVSPVSFDPVLNRKALAAALIMSANGTLEHGPPPTWRCYSPDGAEGAGNSNLAGVGTLTGIGALLLWLHDTPLTLGHRHALLNPRTATFGTGTTGTASALYVFGAPKSSPIIPEVLAWPPSGHVPWPLIQGSWSAELNVPGTIDASQVQVRVSIGGRPATVSGVTDQGTGFSGGRQLKWDVALATGDRDADRTVDVTIDGVKVNGATRLFRYSIQTIRAERPLGTTVTGSRTASTVTIAWQAAVERGVPVTGYRVEGFESVRVIDQTVGPTARQLTLPYTSPGKTLRVQVTPLSRLANGNTGFGVSIPPPATPITQPPPPGPAPPPLPLPPGTLPPPTIKPQPPASTPTPAQALPAFTGPRVSPSTFRAARSGPTIARSATRRGTRVSYSLSVAASVRFTVERTSTGRRVGGRCVKPARANRGRARCTRHVRVTGSFIRGRAAGADRFAFSGRLGGRALKPGSYRLVAKPTAGGRAGSSSRVKFRVVD